jgi:hypothetical protein
VDEELRTGCWSSGRVHSIVCQVLWSNISLSYFFQQENNNITSLLDKWQHLSQSEPQIDDHEKKLKPWHMLCPIGISIVISGLLFVYKICCRPLEDQILDQKVICLTYDLFTTVNSDDVDFKAVISQLNSIIL